MSENYTQINSYQDKLLEAMSIVSSQLISSIPYDKTITCTIINDEEKASGKYSVSNGDIVFDAYSSDTSLKAKDVVYVTIPEGNYDNQKIIQGKKTSDSEKPFIFTTPFDTMLDLTKNIVPSNLSQPKASLIANNGYTTTQMEGKEVINGLKPQYITLCELPDLQHTGYTRLGLKADFMSWIPDCISGSYGLRITLQDNLNTTTTDSHGVTNAAQTKTMLLDVSDMYGSPYKFESYYTQEKVFPIGDLNTITNIKIEFYQIGGSFYNIGGNLLELTEAEVVEDEENGTKQYMTSFGPNLFVDNLYIGLGYDVSEIKDEYIVPIVTSLNNGYYTKDSLSYSSFRDNNEKNIDLRWVHQFIEGPKVVEPETDFTSALTDCEIRWYRYRLGAAAADEYSGVYWIGMTVTKKDGKFILTDWDGKTETVEKLDDEGKVIVDKNTGEKIMITRPVYGEKLALENVTFTPNTSYQSEQIKAIIFLNGVAIRTPIITFTNEQKKSGEEVSDFLNALNIECLDDTNGNYLIYNETGSILDFADTQIERKLGCTFAETGALAHSQLELDKNKDDLISWKIPIRNTMISLQGYDTAKAWTQVNEFLENDYSLLVEQVVNDAQGKFAYNALVYNNKTYYKSLSLKKISDGYHPNEIYISSDGNYIILQNTTTLSQTGEGLAQKTIIKYPTYKITGYYSMFNMNNTIACTIRKNRMIYTAEKEFTFGVAGTMGTDKSIIIDFVGGHNAILANDTQTQYQLQVRMYDENNKPIELTSDIDIQWDWYHPGVAGSEQATAKLNGKLELSPKKGATVGLINHGLTATAGDIYIAKVTVGEEGLTTYFPIPIKYEAQYSHIVGATQVIYLSNGEPEFYKGDYKLYGVVSTGINDEEAVEVVPDTVTWDVISYDNSEFIATVNSDGKYGLSPIGVYTEDVKNYAVRAKIGGQVKWLQPILVIRNKYPSRVINQWDGKTLTIDEKQGTILSTAIAAGKKDNNKFTGVMVGDWTGSISDKSVTGATGVFGFHQGEMCYAFTDDGKAFLGKDGKGRIDFDGNSGKLYSKTGAGMEIDLDDGLITSKRLKLEAGNLSSNKFIILNTDSDGTLPSGNMTPSGNNQYPFEIGRYLKADYTGRLYAASGKIGGWNFIPDLDNTTNRGVLHSGYTPEMAGWSAITLDPVQNMITGGKFKASILEAVNDTMKLGGRLEVYAFKKKSNGEYDFGEINYESTGKGGWLGFVESAFGYSNDTGSIAGGTEAPGIGITAANGGVVKATGINVGMSINGSYLSITGTEFVGHVASGGEIRLDANGFAARTLGGYGRLIADGTHAGIGYGNSYVTMGAAEIQMVSANSKIRTGTEVTDTQVEVDSFSTKINNNLIVGTSTSISTATFNDNLLVTAGSLTIGESALMSSYNLYVGGAATSYFKNSVTFHNGMVVDGSVTSTDTTLNVGCGITATGTISGSTITGTALNFNGDGKSVNFTGAAQSGIRAQFA